MIITAEQLRSLLSYDSETGIFTCRVSRGRLPAGSVAGSVKSDGYCQVQLYGRRYKASRLAWLYMTSEWPKHEIDYINCGRDDNRWSNLREATRVGNCQNTRRSRTNTSGFKGVDFNAGRWRARITVNGELRYLGRFDTPEEAHAAYCEAAERLFGEFARVA